MSNRGRSPGASALTLFVLLATAAQLLVSGLYARGATRVRETPSIEEPELRVMARPLRIARGEWFPQARLEAHLRSIGYYAGCAFAAGCFSRSDESRSLTIWARFPELPSLVLRWHDDIVADITTMTGTPCEEAVIEPETVLTSSGYSGGVQSRTSHDPIPPAALEGTALLDAVIASEDRWFTSHHGLDFTRLALVPVTGLGASTITMQVARLNVLHDRARTLRRKLDEIGVAMALDRTYSKQAILSAYADSVGLGARAGKPIRGFGAAAREFFGARDIRELSELQAATLVALLNQPSRYLDHLSAGNDSRLRAQRNRVLRLMHRTFPGRYSDEWLAALEPQPVVLGSGDVDDPLYPISRHFLDYAISALPALASGRVYLTLDPDLQRVAVEAVDQGLAALEFRTTAPPDSPLQAALIAIRPQSGEVVAMVGGRSYDRSQLNRAVSARRQVGSIIKPFDYLAAFERARANGLYDVGQASPVIDEPTVFAFPGWRPWKPANYENNYAGRTTWRRALAESRNVAAVKVAAFAGLERVARLWESASGQRLVQVAPSVTLGSIEATPAEVATSYAAFATDGIVHPLRAVRGIAEEGAGFQAPAVDPGRRIAHADTVRTVADMLRAVIDEGTGRGARRAGLSVDAAGKTGTTNALRDAWFAGFSGDLLTVVWVGHDDDRPLGLSGAQAALPIWTAFMKRALQPPAALTTR